MEKLIKQLEKRGYRKCGQHKNETVGYWKSFDRKSYQIAVLIWDWREFKAQSRFEGSYYGVQFEFVLGNDGPYGRWDMIICDDKITIIKFEKLCKKFYEEIVLNE